MVAKLINFGADVNIHGSAAGVTSLHVACSGEKSLPVIHLLLKHNACIDKRSWDGVTPLLLALLTNYKDVVKILLDNSADCNIGLYGTQTIKDEIKKKNLEWKTEDLEKAWSFWFAEQFPTSSVVEYIKQAGDQALYSIGKIAPLHVKCFENDIDMIALLLDRHPNINIRIEDGSTPLFVACQMAYVDVATILLEHGAYTDINRNDGKSPLMIARRNNHSEIVCLLKVRKWKTKKRKKGKIRKRCNVS